MGYEVRASITAGEFCRQAELTITRWDLPEALGDHVQLGNIELRYRLPPGAEPVTIWMGVNLELGRITFGDLFRLDRSLAELFPNADPRAPFPTMIPSHSFDLETDNRTRTISVLITPSRPRQLRPDRALALVQPLAPAVRRRSSRRRRHIQRQRHSGAARRPALHADRACPPMSEASVPRPALRQGRRSERFRNGVLSAGGRGKRVARLTSE